MKAKERMFSKASLSNVMASSKVEEEDEQEQEAKVIAIKQPSRRKIELPVKSHDDHSSKSPVFKKP